MTIIDMAHTVEHMRRPVPRTVTRRALPRRLGLLGGTTSWSDCLLAMRYLASPQQLVQGAAIAEFEAAFAQQIGVRHAYSFAAGRVGLYGVLRALGIGPGDEVLLQVPTHIVVANAIRYTGAQPVYVDCRLDTYNIDLDQAEHAVTPRTRALILQHTFGMPADIDGAVALSRRHGIELIEDCVHALGATYAGRPVGSFGRAAFFSTEETKTISTTMGGMVVTDDPDLAGRVATFQARCAWPPAGLTARRVLKLLLYHLLTEPHVHYYTRAAYELVGERHPLPRPTSDEELRGLRPSGYEQRLSNAQAALGVRQLRGLSSNLRARHANATAYRDKLARYGFAVPPPTTKAQPAYVRYPVWVADRATAVRLTAPHAVLGTWFTSVLEEAVSPAVAGYRPGTCPNAERAAQHLVNLPTHPRVKQHDIESLTNALARALTERTRGVAFA